MRIKLENLKWKDNWAAPEVELRKKKKKDSFYFISLPLCGFGFFLGWFVSVAESERLHYSVTWTLAMEWVIKLPRMNFFFQISSDDWALEYIKKNPRPWKFWCESENVFSYLHTNTHCNPLCILSVLIIFTIINLCFLSNLHIFISLSPPLRFCFSFEKNSNNKFLPPHIVGYRLSSSDTSIFYF